MKGYVVVVEEFCADHNNVIISGVVHTKLNAAIREFKNTIIDLAPDEDMLRESTERMVSFSDDEDYTLNIYIHEVDVRCMEQNLLSEIEQHLNNVDYLDDSSTFEDVKECLISANQLLIKVLQKGGQL